MREGTRLPTEIKETVYDSDKQNSNVITKTMSYNEFQQLETETKP